MPNSSLGHKEQKIQLYEIYTMLRSRDKGQKTIFGYCAIMLIYAN